MMPNSRSTSLRVTARVAKPEAVVRLVIRVAVPMRMITRCRALILLPYRENSKLYLFSIYMLFSMPMMISRGGIIPVRMVILYPKRAIMPMDQITWISTIHTGITTAFTERKKRYRKITQTRRARKLKR